MIPAIIMAGIQLYVSIMIHYKLLLVFFAILISQSCFAQGQWTEYEKAMERERTHKKKQDSLLRHLNKKFQISVQYGKMIPNKNVKGSKSLFYFPTGMACWSLGLSWNFTEQYAVLLSGSILYEIDMPQNSSMLSIINGNEIEIEGGGGLIVPVKLGLKYYYNKGRLRPYSTAQIGFVYAKSKYKEVLGNINDGVDQIEIIASDLKPLINFNSGIDYRLRKKVSIGVGIDYYKSLKYEEAIGGYNEFNGFIISSKIAILFN